MSVRQWDSRKQRHTQRHPHLLRQTFISLSFSVSLVISRISRCRLAFLGRFFCQGAVKPKCSCHFLLSLPPFRHFVSYATNFRTNNLKRSCAKKFTCDFLVNRNERCTHCCILAYIPPSLSSPSIYYICTYIHIVYLPNEPLQLVSVGEM